MNLCFLLLSLSGLVLVTGDQIILAIEADGIKFAGCNTCQLLAFEAFVPGICPVTEQLTTAQLSEVIANAESSNTQPYNFDQLIVCCDGTSASNLLLDVLRYSIINEITMDKCTQDFSPSMADFVVIYGLQKVTIISSTSTDYPRNRLDLTQTDEGDTTTNYQNYHIVLLYQNLFDGSNGVRGLSVIYDHTSTNLPAEMTAALQRAPSSVTSKGDNTFLASAIYGKKNQDM
uniref:uncharacterized protein LOC120340184 n=1 Tax=Styela clava TaxID=7725 RepID=UPI001939EADA|nr:uncharacterized protein LOC120340184 [Styela clava]